ncbi:MAG: SIS domain-containing protein [Desulfobacterales bacterium]
MIRSIDRFRRRFRWLRRLASALKTPVYFGRCLDNMPDGVFVFFPVRSTMISCGLTGIVAYKQRRIDPQPVDIEGLEQAVAALPSGRAASCAAEEKPLGACYLGGQMTVGDLLNRVRDYKTQAAFYQIFSSPDLQKRLRAVASGLKAVLDRQTAFFSREMGRLGKEEVAMIADVLEVLKDTIWCLEKEVLENVDKTRGLMDPELPMDRSSTVELFYHLNRVLNSIDRLEVRGRDSAGVSILLMVDEQACRVFERMLEGRAKADPLADLEKRADKGVLINRSVRFHAAGAEAGAPLVSILLTYKVAAEIGRLGDNIHFLRKQIQSDPVLQLLALQPHVYSTISSHTRWASVGAINEANCHPVDARTVNDPHEAPAPIHVCLNGDIDNFIALKASFESLGDRIPEEITTDTKIIPLQIRRYLVEGHSVEEAFRRAVCDFEGSHAISMHTPLAPGKLFLAQRGSGQAVFVGISPDHYMPASEVYGFIEATRHFLKMDGESIVQGIDGPTQGQIIILDQNSQGGLSGIRSLRYDGTPVDISEADIKTTEITSRDIDRQDFPHYFLKEISESPLSVEKTLLNRWKIHPQVADLRVVSLDRSIFPEKLEAAFKKGRIRRIYFVGQGTAGVAAAACADVIRFYLDDPTLPVSALKSSELSGFLLEASDRGNAMSDALVVAISQSGTTTDTNRAVDMVRDRGAFTLAIVNRRDSDLTFKVDGVMYTSSGRDIEMSVASTKAFYSQIVAGILVGLQIARTTGRRSERFVSDEIQQLLDLPAAMRKVIAMADRIGESARRLATRKTYWAVVGSGPNKAAADEIRIKLSELCYKTISSDFVEDKKHIDLSSEPLIIVCAAGARGTVIGDLAKDTAIFKAHKAAPVVIADEGETRFTPHAEDVFHVPAVEEHLAPILNTLVGHLWGYQAALTINEGSRFLFEFRDEVRQAIETRHLQGMDVYEIVLEKSFRQMFAEFYARFRKRKLENRFPSAMGLEAASDLTLLLKYLSGRLPVLDFEIDFGRMGTARNILDTFFSTIGGCINAMARPVDAIKHQAKTVTVGTSRIAERIEGILFDTIAEHGLEVGRILNKNVMVLRNLQGVVSEIMGSILYRIEGLDVLGEITEATTIQIVRKSGVLAPLPSRVETDNRLKGTKEIIVRQGNVYVGKGRKDDRSILIIPVISDSMDTPNVIENLLLLNIGFRTDVGLEVKIKALGGKYQHIRNIVQENNIAWNDRFLDEIEMDELFGRSAEKIGERIAARFA